MARHASSIHLSDEMRRHLEGVATQAAATPHVSTRARIILMAAEGRTNEDIARMISLDPSVVGRWRNQFVRHGWPVVGTYSRRAGVLAGLDRSIPESASSVVSSNLSQFAEATPPVAPVSLTDSILQNQRSGGLKKWNFEGVYVKPPNRAVILSSKPVSARSSTAKTSAQGMAQPVPAGESISMASTFDAGNGFPTGDAGRESLAEALTFMATLIHLDKLITTQADPLYRHREWIVFLEEIASKASPAAELHIILDRHSHGTQKHWRVREWFQIHSQFSVHFVDSTDWLSHLEELLVTLSAAHAASGSFSSAHTAATAISSYYSCVRQAHQRPGPFEWWNVES